MHLVSERLTTGYACGSPEKVMAGLVKDRVGLVVFDELPYITTLKHFVPAVNAHRDRFQILHQVGDHDTYVLALDGSTALPDASNAERLFEEGRERRNQGNLGEAAENLREALFYAPEVMAYWVEFFNVGSDYQRSNEMDKALAIYIEVARGRPGYANVQLNMGILYYKKK